MQSHLIASISLYAACLKLLQSNFVYYAYFLNMLRVSVPHPLYVMYAGPSSDGGDYAYVGRVTRVWVETKWS